MVIGQDSVPIFSSTSLDDVEMFRQVYNSVKVKKEGK